MKIAVSDTNHFKFSGQLIDHWKKQGHDVVKSIHYEHRFLDSDMYFIDCADRNAARFCKEARIRNKKPPTVIFRSLDIDLWQRYFRNFEFDKVDYWVFINNTLRGWAYKQLSNPPKKEKMITIPCGVDTTLFKMREKPINTKKIAWIGRFWFVKKLDDAIKVVREVNRVSDQNHELHILGKKYHPGWWRHYCKHIINQQDFPIKITDHVENVGDWLEDKSHLLLTSCKEAFSYVTAEGMSKGLKPIIHDFWGAREIWPNKYIWQTHGEAAELILGDYQPKKYRKFILDNYDQEKMFNKFDRLIK